MVIATLVMNTNQIRARNPTGRGRGLKILLVSVRIRPGLPISEPVAQR